MSLSRLENPVTRHRSYCQRCIAPALLATVLFAVWRPALHAAAPAWWAERGVLSTGTPDDYRLLNQGQLKHLALQGYYELQARLPGGAGATLDALIAGWLNPTGAVDDYAVLNLGQLKNTAQPFYDRLTLFGYEDPPLIAGQAYPWVGPSADDYVYANLGQAKFAFSFDLAKDTDGDALPDWWENTHGLNRLSVADVLADPDQDGLSNLQEFLAGTDPNAANGAGAETAAEDTDGDGLTNAAELTAGTNPNLRDTDGDGYWDGADAAPLNAGAWLPAAVPGDLTPPVIVLLKP